MSDPLQVMCVGAVPAQLSASAYGPFDCTHCASLDDAARALRDGRFDAVLLRLESCGAAPALLGWPSLSHAVLDAAVLVHLPDPGCELVTRLVQRGVQDVIELAGAEADGLGRAIRLAVERKRLERAARKAYATDLATGLPNHAQLLEHMSHLLALREREPAPMALLALRVEGLGDTEAALGSEAANVLRRKLAVRLRAGLRASDVVASLGGDAFAVLLAWIDAPDDAVRVATKLVASLQQPVPVAGQPQTVSVTLGLSQYPQHGRQADELLRRALGQAASSAAALGGHRRAPAANDE